MARHDDKGKRERRDDKSPGRDSADRDDAADRTQHPNPPYTKTKRMVSPKFGSAGSGGAENEPGPERD